VYGVPDECRKFDERHPLWAEAMAHIAHAVNIAFTRVEDMDSAADRLAFFLGRICAEDFNEITLVCYHGCGIAAAKLLRSMYEHVVTLHYLHEHPDEVSKFIAYGRIQNDKLASRLVETFGANILPPEDVKRIKDRASEVKNDFMIPECDHPDAKKRLNHSWSKLDFVAMAKKTGELGKFVVLGYYMPLRHAHTSFAGIIERLEMVGETMTATETSQPNLIDCSLKTAHFCLLDAIWLQEQRFKIEELAEALHTCKEDFAREWSVEPHIGEPRVSP
jgi:hypothetical protein